MSATAAIPFVVEQHVDEAAFLWSQRRLLLRRADIGLPDLAQIDDRLDAHLDGLRVLGTKGWLAAKSAQAAGLEGAAFATTVLALESRNRDRIDLQLASADADPNACQAFRSALGWVPASDLVGIVVAMLAAESAVARGCGVAAGALHRVDLREGLGAAIRDPDRGVRLRALKACGELGRIDMLADLAEVMTHADAGERSWASWSAMLLGDPRGRDVALADGVAGGAFSAATELFLRSADLGVVHRALRQWSSAVSEPTARQRWLLRGIGIAGDPRYVPWVIDLMSSDDVARAAGEAFMSITGADLVALGLVREAPSGLESGPSDDPDDGRVGMDEDDGLPWPDANKVKAWWQASAEAFPEGSRYMAGQPPTRLHCLHVLRTGPQRLREAAAEHLCLLSTGTPLFNVAAPAWRQIRLLAATL